MWTTLPTYRSYSCLDCFLSWLFAALLASRYGQVSVQYCNLQFIICDYLVIYCIRDWNVNMSFGRPKIIIEEKLILLCRCELNPFNQKQTNLDSLFRWQDFRPECFVLVGEPYTRAVKSWGKQPKRNFPHGLITHGKSIWASLYHCRNKAIELKISYAGQAAG